MYTQIVEDSEQPRKGCGLVYNDNTRATSRILSAASFSLSPLPCRDRDYSVSSVHGKLQCFT